MRRRRTHFIAACSLLAAALFGGAAALAAEANRAQGVDMATVRAGSLGRDSRSSALRLPLRADMLGATWSGSADAIEVRAKGADGRWSQWVELHEGADAPDPGSAEARAARRRSAPRTASNPIWVGDADAVQVRSHDGLAATDVRVVAINATGSATRRERLASTLRASAAHVLGEAVPSASAQPLAPGIRSRTKWGASAPRSAPSIADAGVQGVVIHHTNGTNRYSCSQVPAVLRGIQRYHMRSNGWNDIGYNYLVDACGGVWEGRAGGLTKAVIGAHTAGFNSNTAGIALIGNHVGTKPTPKARLALQRLVAWRLDVAHVLPTGKMALTARSGDKFPNGSRVVVRAVSGHRDLFPTSCPGALAYRDLAGIARGAWLIGGAKVANITSGYTLAAPQDPTRSDLASVTVRAIGSSKDMNLTARLERVSTGQVLKDVAITGPVIATTWRVPAGLSIPVWDVRIVVNGARGEQRARAATVPLVRGLTADPGFVVTAPPAPTVAPGGDPLDDVVRLQYTLAQDYRVGAWLHDPATGAQVAELFTPDYVGPTATPAELELAIPRSVADGTYELRVGLPTDPTPGRSIRSFPLTVDRTP